MDTGVKTRTRGGNEPNPRHDPLFGKLPPKYYGYALQWCNYTRWTIDEAANLLTGCVPHREMFLPGKEHARLDQEVLEVENKIRAALGSDLKTIKGKKYFAKVCIDSTDILHWARRQDIVVPEDLLRAAQEAKARRERAGYTTPCLEAIDWVIQTWWAGADLREPPTPGEIIQALLQQFPDLTGQECEMIEKVTRHPTAGPDDHD